MAENPDTDEAGGKGGRSWTGSYDLRTRTARPTSVGPHHREREQEDPANPGIRPEDGYGAEIARNNDAAAGQPFDPGRTPVLPPEPKLADVEELKARSGPARDAPPLTGTAQE